MKTMTHSTLRPEILVRFEGSTAALRESLDDLMRNLRIPEPVDIVDWIEDHVRIPKAVSTVGKTKLRLYGYQRGLARLAVAASTKHLAVMKGTRTGLTQECAAIDAYHVAHEGKPVGLWQPTEDKAKKFYSDYWIPMFKESPKLKRFLRRPVKGDIQDRWNWMQFTNGAKFVLGYASSDDQFRGDTVAITDGDEVDAEGWRAGKKGSQGAKFKLMWERSRTFWDRKQKLWSSPLEEATSNIYKAWLSGDQRHYMVRCPHPNCRGVQYLKWGGSKTDYGIRWEVDDDGFVVDAWYVCEHCHEPIDESEKYAMDDEAGDAIYGDDDQTPMQERLGWNQPTKIPERPGYVSCHVPGYISLFAGANWKQLAQEWVDAQGKPEDLQAFVNNVLGEPWRAIEISQAVDVGSYAHRRPVPFEGVVPGWARYLTAYIDVQEGWQDESKKLRQRFEVQVVAWGPGYEAAMVGHFVLQDHPIFSPASVAQLDDIIFRKWIRAGDSAKLQIVIAGIDASHRQTEVLAVCNAPARRRVYRPMKGESEVAVEKAPIIVNAPKMSESRVTLIRVGTRRAKDLAERLRNNETPGPYHLHIPSSMRAAVDTDDGRRPFFDQLFAEKKVLDHGVEKWVRVKTGAADTGEVWDCLVGNVAAIQLAILTYPKPVGREIVDMRPQPPRERYDDEDRSIMADVLADKLARGFVTPASGETLSIVPPPGETARAPTQQSRRLATTAQDPIREMPKPAVRTALGASNGPRRLAVRYSRIG